MKGRNPVRVLEDNSQVMPREGPDILQKCPSIIYAAAGGGTANEVEDDKECRVNSLEMKFGEIVAPEAQIFFYMIDCDYCTEGAKNIGPPS